MINTTRETVTRSFQVLQTRGVLARQGDRLLVAQPAPLRALAEGQVAQKSAVAGRREDG